MRRVRFSYRRPETLLLFWRHLGWALWAPLGLVAVTGFLLLVVYRPEPLAGPRDLQNLPPFYEGVRRVHLWSSRALLAAGVFHTLRVWYDGLVSGAARKTYVAGALGFGVLGLSHLTGHILRWDAAGRLLAEMEVRALAFLGGARWILFTGDTTSEGLLQAHVPIHVAVLPLLGVAAIVMHVGTFRGARWATASGPRTATHLRRAVLSAATLGLLTVAAALLIPSPTAQVDAPWPFEPFFRLARLAGRMGLGVGVAAAGILGAYLAVLAQPWLMGAPALKWLTRAGLAVAFVLSLWFEAF